MGQPFNPEITEALERLRKALNNLASAQSERDRLTAFAFARGRGQTEAEAAAGVPESTEYDFGDAVQLITEIASGVQVTLNAQGQAFTQAEWDTLFLHILKELPGRLLPGVSTAEIVPPGAAPTAPTAISLAESAMTLKAVNIRRFPNHALIGLQEGAIALALRENKRISPELFTALMGGGAFSDEVAAQARDVYAKIRDNRVAILAAATGEALGADFKRAVSSSIGRESQEDLVAGISLYPIIPGFGVPEAKKFTDKEAIDLRENFAKLLKIELPTTNQLDSVEERTTRRRFIDDLVKEAQAVTTHGGPDELRRLQNILDNAPDRFEDRKSVV